MSYLMFSINTLYVSIYYNIFFHLYFIFFYLLSYLYYIFFYLLPYLYYIWFYLLPYLFLSLLHLVPSFAISLLYLFLYFTISLLYLFLSLLHLVLSLFYLLPYLYLSLLYLFLTITLVFFSFFRSIFHKKSFAFNFWHLSVSILALLATPSCRKFSIRRSGESQKAAKVCARTYHNLLLNSVDISRALISGQFSNSWCILFALRLARIPPNFPGYDGGIFKSTCWHRSYRLNYGQVFGSHALFQGFESLMHHLCSIA